MENFIDITWSNFANTAKKSSFLFVNVLLKQQNNQEKKFYYNINSSYQWNGFPGSRDEALE